MNQSSVLKPAIFVDRDGTLVEEVNYLSDVKDLRLFPSTAAALTQLKTKGFWIIVITNQSGIGRGIYNVAAMDRVHHAMQRQLGGLIDNFYYCPHTPSGGCSCRKPLTGMIDQARERFRIDMSRSWMIGDKVMDIETGINAQVRTALVLTGYGRQHRDLLFRAPDVIAENIGEAAAAILTYPDHERPKSSSNLSMSSSPK